MPANVDAAHAETGQVAQLGRPGRNSDGANSGSFAPDPSSADPSSADPMADIMNRYERLGESPPTVSMSANDDAYGGENLGPGFRAHTLDRHGSDIPLERDPETKTVEGRIYGDAGWNKRENWSYKWDDPVTMNREINNYLRHNWESIRSDLAIGGAHVSSFDAGHRVGEGYYNTTMGQPGEPAAHRAATSFVKLVIKIVPGSDPPEPYVITAYPSGTL
ncbi:hypothetical protein [Actinoplanes sp. NPDC051494]|uniref:hypothetical protein n=1 Tax=Actinoplanes sp. NPDC051494 TaxID=3363907 RepID=UPI00379CA807